MFVSRIASQWHRVICSGRLSMLYASMQSMLRVNLLSIQCAVTNVRRPGVACSVSGVGEVIIRACLAKECCQRMFNLDLPVDEACSQVMQESTMQVC